MSLEVFWKTEGVYVVTSLRNYVTKQRTGWFLYLRKLLLVCSESSPKKGVFING